MREMKEKMKLQVKEKLQSGKNEVTGESTEEENIGNAKE